VFVCETHPYREGYKSYQELSTAGVECRVILDNEVNTYMDKIDIVLVGAQIVLENGAIISRVHK
jgi:translation initiation factor 2B subunit (eIF-2B alpha/beta/delta family)